VVVVPHGRCPFIGGTCIVIGAVRWVCCRFGATQHRRSVRKLKEKMKRLKKNLLHSLGAMPLVLSSTIGLVIGGGVVTWVLFVVGAAAALS
jgi:hypothetical protein